MNKKGAELPMNVIIVAALAIIVLVVLVVIFGGKMKLFGKSLNTCDGACSATKEGCGPYRAAVPMTNCDDNADGKANVEGNGFCCKEVG